MARCPYCGAFEGDNHHTLCVSQQREHLPIRADIDVDPQHGPIIRVRVGGRWVSVYLETQNGVVTEPSGSQYGIEVKGPWYKFEPYMSSKINCASCIELKAERQHGMKFAQALAAHKSPTTTEIYLRDRVAKVVSLGV